MSNVKKPEPVGWGIFYQGMMQDIPRNEQAALAIAEEDYVGHVMAVKPVFSSDQVDAYKDACVREALEEAAKVCETYYKEMEEQSRSTYQEGALDATDILEQRIRALIPKQ